jgi:hypothetical protein
VSAKLEDQIEYVKNKKNDGSSMRKDQNVILGVLL